MQTKVVKKSLAAQQDILLGVNTVQQIRGGKVVNVNGLAKSFIDLWKDSLGDAYAGTFEDGCTLTQAQPIAVSLLNGKPYSWNGSLPHTVVPGLDPAQPNSGYTERNDVTFRAQVFPMINDTINRTLAMYNYAPVYAAAPGISLAPTTAGFPPVRYGDKVYHPPYNIMSPFTIATVSEALWGALTITDTNGNTYIFSQNETIESDAVVFGEEYLEHFHRVVNVASGTNNPSRKPAKVVLSGDSTTVGVGASSDAFKPHIQLSSIASAAGYSYVTVVNKGVSGGSTYQWADLWIPGELAEQPDLLVLRWGVNDPATSSVTVASFEKSLRSGLATIRERKGVADLSILLMTPCTTDNDAGTRRVNEWHVAINRVIRRAARDFMCCFVDTHRILADAKNSAGIWMDSVDATSTRVHPLDILYTKIAQLMARVAFPHDFTLAQTNRVFNLASYTGSYTGVEDSSAFSSGLTLQRFESNDPSQPFNGMITTIKHCEGAALQLAVPYYGLTPGKAVSFRMSYKNEAVPSSLGNTLFTGIERTPTLKNGWTFPTSGFKGLVIKLSVDGDLKLAGTLVPGTLTAGTVLFTISNAYLRPALPVIIPAIADVSGSMSLCQIAVQPSGDVVYTGPTSGVFRIHINGSVPL